jgi:hypothetical protein
MKTEYGPAMMPDALHILLSDKMSVRSIVSNPSTVIVSYFVMTVNKPQ